MDPKIPTRQNSAGSSFSKDSEFFTELTLRLGIALDEPITLTANKIFTGPSGLLCRVQTKGDQTQLKAKPEVMLPLAMSDLQEDGVKLLMALQDATLSELGWYLGLSEEGLLAVSPIGWTEQAKVVAAELDLGHILGRMVLDVMTEDPDDHRIQL